MKIAARGSRIELLPLGFLLPTIALRGLVIFWPLVTGFGYSLYAGTMLKAGAFVGADNYLALAAEPDFWHALRFSAVFALANVCGCYLLGSGIALLLNGEMPARGVLRVVFLLPWTVPSIVSAVAWRWLVVDANAPVNMLLGAMGIGPVYFLSSDIWAQVVVFVVKIWRSFPFMMLSLLAVLQGIDRALHEATAIDGATRWQSFRYVTLPHLRNTSIILCILMTIWTINDFETPFLNTGGGSSFATKNLVELALRYAFARNQVRPGSAVSFITFLILAVLAIVLLRRQRSSG